LAHLRRKTPQTGLFAPIFWLKPKGFPLQSLAPHGFLGFWNNLTIQPEKKTTDHTEKHGRESKILFLCIRGRPRGQWL
ncbi:MAG: hypothetical protein LBT33_11185, partial [Spirochaetia bacterium]|jgi:hypothetical protein|nr:hypothetical protein [Spirochaetia bacterium]